MKNLTIEDLSKNDQIDRTAMIPVSGGRLPLVIANYIQSISDNTQGPSGQDQKDPATTMFQHLLQQLTQGQG